MEEDQAAEAAADEEANRRRRLASSGQLTTVVAMVLLHHVERMERNKQFGPPPKKKRGSTGPRCKRRAFDHQGAHGNIHRDHLGPDPLFGKEVVVFFRLSRPRVQMIIEALGNSGDKHFTTFRRDKFGRVGASLEAKVLLPLRVLAYGVAPHTFNDYFQVSVSMARSCVKRFNRKMVEIFKPEFLRKPTAEDIREITSLHKTVHGVDGMLGSMDCMHTYWKNCPKAWQGQYNGKSGGPTIVLEAVADHYLYIWHASYGYSGSLNDLNILNKSPLLEGMVDGTFRGVEEQSNVVPFVIGEEVFDKLFVLVDGIYPRYSRFVRGLTQPITPSQTKFTAWQESARKDIERAFGVLQCKFKAISTPIHLIGLPEITCMVDCCLVLHNMAVSDRVMGDVTKRYSPSSRGGGRLVATDVVDEIVAMEAADEILNAETPCLLETATQINVRAFDSRLANTIARRDEWERLADPEEWGRLQHALVRLKGGDSEDEE
jgi:hypothetical protein